MKDNPAEAEGLNTGPTLAQRARRLMHIGVQSSLSTMSVKHPGYPFGSVMPYAIDESGTPIFLISQMAVHAKNLRANPRATLLVAEESESPMAAARLSIIGDVSEIDNANLQGVRQAYLGKHPESKQWVEFADFGFYRMIVKEIYLIGGFGVMGWVSAEDYSTAELSPNID